MRIWKRTDYIGDEGKHRRELNVHGVIVENQVPLCLAHNHITPPLGRVENIVVDPDDDAITGEITGDIVFTDPQWQTKSVQIIDDYVCLVDQNATKYPIAARYRLAMYANNLVESRDTAGRLVVQSCHIREVSLIPEQAWPASEMKPAVL